MNEQFFSKRTYPVLDWIENGLSKEQLYGMFYEVDMGRQETKAMVPTASLSFEGLIQNGAGNNVRYISSPFHQAIERASETMTTPELWNNVEAQTGTLLLPNHFTFMYQIMGSGLEDNMHSSLAIFFYRDKIMAFTFQDPKDKTNTVWASAEFIHHARQRNSTVEKTMNDQELQGHLVAAMYTKLIATLNFIKYAEIETKYLPPKKKIKETHCRYFNDSKSKITILDSSWFTTIVQSQGFGVRSHFRLQACGPGMKDRKLIYIKDFQKQGYTRTAKKLNDETMGMQD